VTDTGIGMSAEVRRRAFEPFFTTKGPAMGSGLGLSMVYGFVKQSNGFIRIHSELGRGTTVRIYLPVRKSKTAPWKGARGDANVPVAKGETILAVEDDPLVRKVTVRRLEALGYRVVEAHSGGAALRIFKRRRSIDMIFTDILMPGGMTGAELARRARRHRSDIKILFTSGYANASIVRKLVAKRGGWIGKPYTTNDLAIKLREVLEA
jgi:CheY-like chemotaxis protein